MNREALGVGAVVAAITTLTSTGEALAQTTPAEEFAKEQNPVSEKVTVSRDQAYDEAMAKAGFKVASTQSGPETTKSQESIQDQAFGAVFFVDSPYYIKRNSFISNSLEKMDVAPQIVDGRTMLPLRFAAQATGAAVDWDAATSTATIKTESRTIKATIGNKTMFVQSGNGTSQIEMDVAPQIINGRTMVPVRYVATALGYQVDWNPEKQAVVFGGIKTENLDRETLAAKYEAKQYMADGDYVDILKFNNRVERNSSGAVIVYPEGDYNSSVSGSISERLSEGDVAFVDDEGGVYVFSEESQDHTTAAVKRIDASGSESVISRHNHRYEGIEYHSNLTWYQGKLVVSDGYRVTYSYDKNSDSWVEIKIPETMGTPLQRVIKGVKQAAESGDYGYGIDAKDAEVIARVSSDEELNAVNDKLKTVHIFFWNGKPLFFMPVGQYGIQSQKMIDNVNGSIGMLAKIDPKKPETLFGGYGAQLVVTNTARQNMFEVSRAATFYYDEVDNNSMGVVVIRDNVLKAYSVDDPKYWENKYAEIGVIFDSEIRGLYVDQSLVRDAQKGSVVTKRDKLSYRDTEDKSLYALRDGIVANNLNRLTGGAYTSWITSANNYVKYYCGPDQLNQATAEYKQLNSFDF